MPIRDLLRRTRRRVRAVLVLTGLLGACAAPGPLLPPQPRSEPRLAPDYVLGPVRAHDPTEFEELAPLRTDAARLRRAWIELEQGRHQGAIDGCALVLYGADRPSPQAEALARYIRAEAFARRGEPERGSYDRQRALELALDPALRERIGSSGAAVAAAQPAPAARLAVQGRAAWQPDPPIASRLEPMGRIFRLTVHHSAMLFRSTSPQACAAQLRQIQHNHMRNPDRRYGDIGYHFLIDPAGRVWEGRELRWQGAHARDDNNRGNIGICVLGNFIHGGQTPNDAQLHSLQSLVHGLADAHAIAPRQIHNHSDFVVTECPGPFLEPFVARLVREREALAQAGRAEGSGVY